MAKTEKNSTPKMGPWAKFMHWYESYKGKRAVGVVYSVGASIVIIGALFKILHWPGASYVLMVGMFTEAFLFVIGALDKPHPEFNWGNVFPQLLEYGTDPAILEAKANQARPTLLGAGVEGGATPAMGNGTDTAAHSALPALNEKEIKALQNGIEDLAKTATQLSELGKVATATTQLSAKMEAAGAAAEQFTASQAGLLATSAKLGEAYQTAEANMQKTAEVTNGFAQNIESVGSKLTTLNSIYELQINALQQQADSAKAQAATLNHIAGTLQNIETSTAEAQKSHAEYTAATKKLAAQVADLNAIYGNMLNALA